MPGDGVDDVCHAANLVEALAALRDSHVRWLIANGRGFGDSEAISIARALKSNKTLEELSLAGNRIGPNGAAALGDAVASHPRMREFYIHKNILGQKGIERMAAAMKPFRATCKLQVLNASANGIGPRFPPDLALPRLKSLMVKNNNIRELPPCFAECASLSEVVLDNNPLVSPPIQVYAQNGWHALRSFLLDSLDREKMLNQSFGLGSVSNRTRDDSIFGAIEKAMNRGALAQALLEVEKATEVFKQVGEAATGQLAKCKQLRRVVVGIAGMDDPAAFQKHVDCAFRQQGSEEEFTMCRETVAERSPFLHTFLCESGYDTTVNYAGEKAIRRIVEVPDTSSGGLRCFLSYLLLGDLHQAVMISCKLDNMSDVANGSEASSDDDSSEDDEASDTDSDSSGHSQPRKPVPPEAPLANYISACNGTSTGTELSGEETTPGEEMSEQSSGQDEHRAAMMEGLSGDMVILLDAVDLAKRFEVEQIHEAAAHVLWERLRPWNVLPVLKATHVLGESRLKKVCTDYLDEYGTQVEEQAWHILKDQGSLMVEVLDALAQKAGPSVRGRLSSVLLMHVLRRLEDSEARAHRQKELRIRTERQLDKLTRFWNRVGPAFSSPSMPCHLKGPDRELAKKVLPAATSTDIKLFDEAKVALLPSALHGKEKFGPSTDMLCMHKLGRETATGLCYRDKVGLAAGTLASDHASGLDAMFSNLQVS
eukprot:CAMPEP_0181311680 /NCGR_PEP_ID=MMETSP1101-20121128/13274_1 /TAXON_ID=46948 /ORGANISM="Rhodomonas abbreviata, Strain Caron Lab Isolate" /LENGTH=709 /DNA_ID=CAMNT_0023418443 /DNA_START=6 /DNA_END=2135 /DNA_ORIENTATION=+